MRVLLRPLAAAYESAIRLRWQFYASGLLRVSRLRNPVISIGNLTMGGTGKTPVTIALAGLLQSSGHHVAVLSKGYGGRHRGQPLLVSDGQRILSTAKAAGDEALVLAENLPQTIVAVARNRVEAGAWVEQRFEVDVHLLDDGFQHLTLHRDLNLLLIDATNPFGSGLPPLGRLREPPQAITRADAVIFTRAEATTDLHRLKEEVQKFKPGIPCFTARQRLASAKVLAGARTPIDALRDSKALAFAGIANPRQFFAMLHQNGIHLRDSIGFRDHHDYSQADYKRLKARCQRLSADTLITTEKDAVKLGPTALSPLRVVVIRIAFDVDDLEALCRLLSAAAGIVT
jgi:tetraacyldisaccharide 4'-kinase